MIAKAPPSKRADLAAELARPEVQRALQKAEGGMDADLAAQLAPQLGNDALQELLKAGSETSTGSTNATAVDALGQESEEGQEEEQERESDQDLESEVQAILPSFSGPSGAPGASPWAMGKFFGGEGEADEDAGATPSGRWRPMPSLPEPEDLPLGGVDDPEPPAAGPDGSWLDEARRALGRAPWSKDLLGRGLRDPVPLCRPFFEPESLDEGLNTPFGRARAALALIARHAEPLDVRRRAWTLCSAGSALAPHRMGYSGATARALHGLEAALEGLPDRMAWERMLEARLCLNARSVAEQAADRLEPGTLGAVALFKQMPSPQGPATGASLLAGGSEGRPHPAALEALALACRLAPMPEIEPWTAIAPGFDDVDGTAAIDRVLASFTTPVGRRAHPLEPLFNRMNTLLDALGLAQVELAGAAFAAVAAGVARAQALDAITEGDAALVRVARRLVRVGRALEAEGDEATITALSWEVVAVREGAELARTAAVEALAREIATETSTPDDDTALTAAIASMEAARFHDARMSAPPDLLAGIALREGRPAVASEALLRDTSSVGLSLRIGVALTLGQPVGALSAALLDLGQREGRPFAVAEAAIAQTVDAPDPFEPLRAAAPWLRERGAGGPLALLLARWGELRLQASAAGRPPG